MIDYVYHQPETLEEVFALMERYGDRATLVAGGTDVLVNIRRQRRSPEALISLRKLEGLKYIRKNGGYHIGALTTHRMLEQSELVRCELKALQQAAAQVGSVQIRNVATIGGNICNAAPSADTLGPLLMFDAVFVLQGPSGRRRVPAEAFFLGPAETVKTADEILTAIEIPAGMRRYKSAYRKHARRQALNLPIVGVCVGLALAEDGRTIKDARIALTVAAPTAIRIAAAETFLTGKPFSDDVLAEAGRIASSPECCMPRDSLRCEAWYREEMIRVLIPRVARAAVGSSAVSG